MAVSTRTWVAGELVTAAIGNTQWRDNIDGLYAGNMAIAAQAANDVVIATSASQLGRVAAGTAGQFLTSQGPGAAPIYTTPSTGSFISICDGRITLSTGVAVPPSDVTAATTIYFTPYKGNQVALFDGAAWTSFTLTERSIAIPAVANKIYDVFLFNNAGTLTLELVAWTNDTTRATVLIMQDGVLVKSGATTRRYLGSVRTTAVAGQTEDSAVKRLVWNYVHRVSRPLRVTDGADSWNYSTSIWRQANANTANQVAIVVGVAEDTVQLLVSAQFSLGLNQHNEGVAVGVGSTSTPTAPALTLSVGSSAPQKQLVTTSYVTIQPAGYQFYAWLEWSDGSPTVEWYGDGGGTVETGIKGWMIG